LRLKQISIFSQALSFQKDFAVKKLMFALMLKGYLKKADLRKVSVGECRGECNVLNFQFGFMFRKYFISLIL
jgi:hypothetical protein